MMFLRGVLLHAGVWFGQESHEQEKETAGKRSPDVAGVQKTGKEEGRCDISQLVAVDEEGSLALGLFVVVSVRRRRIAGRE